MCGRFVLTTALEGLRALFHFEESPNLPPRHNIAPTQPVAVVRADASGTRHLSQLRWGLVPSWAKELSVGARMINARSEGIADKPAFREAFARRRCLIAADGFYEWQTLGKGPKQPFLFHIAVEVLVEVSDEVLRQLWFAIPFDQSLCPPRRILAHF